MIDWTDDMIETMLRLHRAGLTGAAIADSMNRRHDCGLTRNAVIGKLHRLGKKDGKKKPAPARRAPPRAASGPHLHPGNIARKKASLAFDPGIETYSRRLPLAVTAPPDCAPVAFGAIETGQCRFPVDTDFNATGPAMQCCGADVVDRFKPEGDRRATHCRYHLERLTQ